jgi:hypothetical protein
MVVVAVVLNTLVTSFWLVAAAFLEMVVVAVVLTTLVNIILVSSSSFFRDGCGGCGSHHSGQHHSG